MSAFGRLLGSVAAAALPVALAAQGTVVGRLDGRVAPDVVRAVQEIAGGVAARGLPVEPLVDKAIEGAAKHVPTDRVIAAVRALAGRLDEAATALRAGGVTSPGADAIEGGADALNAGLSAAQVRDLVALSSGHLDPALTLRVAATLAALGVPPSQALDLVHNVIQGGGGARDLLDLPSQVETGVARGATPAQAAGALGHGDAATHGPATRPLHQPPPGQTNPHKP
ncbi:MAG TPA: hypothetical protein VEU55_07760 [Gemmatimonadales bacterium]|nr:hypothetical protein [Gemmatimonadales bacterium]